MTKSQKHALAPRCDNCDTPTAQITLTEKFGKWHLQYKGPGGENGRGDEIPAKRAHAILAAFTPPYNLSQIRAANFYDDAGFCTTCERFYCQTHWNMTNTGGGWCPEGHFKSLDPHWSPE